MKKFIRYFIVFVLLLNVSQFTGCNNNKDPGINNSGSCPSGSWPTLDDCIDAKIAAGVDDDCNCWAPNFPDGPWYMQEDD